MNGAGMRNQSELARRSGVPQPKINRILKGVGRQGPATEILKELAAACEVSFQWLGDGTGAKPRAGAEQKAALVMPEPDIDHLFIVSTSAERKAAAIRNRTDCRRSL